MNESKKLKEVWEWKEKVYEKTKNMKQIERIDFFNRGLDEFEKKTGIKLTKKVQPFKVENAS